MKITIDTSSLQPAFDRLTDEIKEFIRQEVERQVQSYGSAVKSTDDDSLVDSDVNELLDMLGETKVEKKALNGENPDESLQSLADLVDETEAIDYGSNTLLDVIEELESLAVKRENNERIKIEENLQVLEELVKDLQVGKAKVKMGATGIKGLSELLRRIVRRRKK